MLTLPGLRGLLLPRPLSFLANTLHFGGGVFFAWLEVYKGHPFLSALPAQPQASLYFVLAWFVVQELLLQQAKYMWNDLRDHERDRQLPANRQRTVAVRPLSRRLYALLAARWLLGVSLAALLSPALLVLVLALSALQIAYEYLAKPYAGRLPTLPLFIVGAGASLKFLGGALALGWTQDDPRLWLYGLALFGTGIVYGSSCWRVEADFFLQRRLPLPRGQSGYFMAFGMLWLYAGASVGVTASLVLLADAYGDFLPRLMISPIVALPGLAAAAALLCLLFFGVWRRLLPRVRRRAAVLLLAGGLVAAVSVDVPSKLPVSVEFAAALLLLLVLVYDYRLNYQSDYRRFNLLYLAQNLTTLRVVFRELLRLEPKPAMVSGFLPLILAVNSPKFTSRLERYRRRAMR